MLANLKSIAKNINNERSENNLKNIQKYVNEDISNAEKTDTNLQSNINLKNPKSILHLDLEINNKYNDEYTLNIEQQRLDSKSIEFGEDSIDEKIHVKNIYTFDTLPSNERFKKDFKEKTNENNKILSPKKQNNETTKKIISEINNKKNIIEEISNEIDIFIENRIPLSRILELKDYKYMRDKIYDIDNLVNYTYIIFNDEKCILLLKDNFLYILESSPKITEKSEKFSNPEISLLHQIEVSDRNFTDNDKKSLKYYFNISNALISINFELLTCKLLLKKTDLNEERNNNNEIKILIFGYNNPITFYIDDYYTYKKFSKLIAKKIFNNTSFYENKLGIVLSRKNFLTKTYISPKEFESKAKTGDILLFSAYDCCSNFQKFFTRDQYDHVAVVKISHKKIYIYEATSTFNCKKYSWDKFKYFCFNLYYKIIAFRQLNIEENDVNKYNQIMKNIENSTDIFINETSGLKYNLKICKMVCCDGPEDYEDKGEWKKSDGYCCSSLIAAMYIKAGIMKFAKRKSVHSVRPGEYEQDRNRINFLPGFSLGPEKIIEFST